MRPVVCHLRKYTIWDSRITNNQKETKQTLLCQQGIKTNVTVVPILLLFDYLLCGCHKLYLFVTNYLPN
jgi:hypothetical protein